MQLVGIRNLRGAAKLQAAAATQVQAVMATQVQAVVVYHVAEVLQYYLGHWFSMMNLPDLMQKRFRIWLTQGFMIRWNTCKLQLQMERFGVLILIQG
jgi:hypothetical protein